MKILSLFILLISISGQTCEYSLKVKSEHNISSLESFIEKELTNIGYIRANGIYSFEINSKLGTDQDAPQSQNIRSSIKLKKFNHLENYTHGVSSGFENQNQVHLTEKYKESLRLAVSHLPRCK